MGEIAIKGSVFRGLKFGVWGLVWFVFYLEGDEVGEVPDGGAADRERPLGRPQQPEPHLNEPQTKASPQPHIHDKTQLCLAAPSVQCRV